MLWISTVGPKNDVTTRWQISFFCPLSISTAMLSTLGYECPHYVQLDPTSCFQNNYLSIRKYPFTFHVCFKKNGLISFRLVSILYQFQLSDRNTSSNKSYTMFGTGEVKVFFRQIWFLSLVSNPMFYLLSFLISDDGRTFGEQAGWFTNEVLTVRYSIDSGGGSFSFRHQPVRQKCLYFHSSCLY